MTHIDRINWRHEGWHPDFYHGGLSDIEWACEHLPVLAIDRKSDVSDTRFVGVGTRTYNRIDLAARLGVDPDRPLAAQLVGDGRITIDQAQSIDWLFYKRKVRIRLRIDAMALDVPDLICQFQMMGLIETVEDQTEHNGFSFVTMTTTNFVALAEALMACVPEHVALLALDNQILSHWDNQSI